MAKTIIKSGPNKAEIENIFDQYATGMKDGSRVMTVEDVKRLMGPLSEEKIKVNITKQFDFFDQEN